MRMKTESAHQQVVLPGSRAAQELTVFARTVLGCGCPEEVFDDMCVEWCAAPSVQCLVRIGGRLMVGVCHASGTAWSAETVGQLLRWGQQLRDREGYNRFRLLIAVDAGQSVAAGTVDENHGFDERMHVHVEPAAVLPELVLRGILPT